MGKRRALAIAMAALAVGAAATGLWAEPSATILQLRRDFLDPRINSLTFHNIDEIFETRPVPAGRSTWPLPERPAPLNFTYEFAGQIIPATEFAERTFTNALLVLKDGAIVHERYLNQTGADTHFLSMSVAKSITSILVGMAVGDGAIASVDDPITRYVPELAGSGYRDVTIRQALQMRSGADWDERYDFERQTPMARLHHGAIVENRIRFVSAAQALGRKHAPGTVFNYSTVETAVLGWVVERATRKPLAQYMSERFWQPAGMQSPGFWLADGPPGTGNVVNGMGFNAVLRDYGRIGLMMLNGGRAGSTQLLPAAWVEDSTRPLQEPIAAGETRGYAWQWWTLTGSPAYLAVGLQGQFIFVDPATATVIVKLSYFPPGEQRADAEAEAFFRAASQWKPRRP